MQLEKSELGKKSTYITKYDAALLFAIPRINKRLELGIDINNTPFYGVDLWNHYEVSWLNKLGKPEVAICEISYPSNSANIIESKSMKLYFNSFNSTQIESIEFLQQILIKDISKTIDANASVKIYQLSDPHLNTLELSFTGTNIDKLEISCDTYQPKPDYLIVTDKIVEETLYSNLLKSNCLVTNQPDWGSVQISYRGNKINHEGLLKYIVSLRDHNEFHEQCVERIFNDIWTRCRPLELTVYARYTRRGGIEINPYRTSIEGRLPYRCRLIRQ